jgi:hypothetical protein
MPNHLPSALTPAPKPRWRAIGAALTLAAATLAAPAAQAALMDPLNDFLSTYSGPKNGDLDVLSVDARQDGTNVTLTSILDGAIGTTGTGVYIWGVNRGAGTEGLQAGTPPVGAGVFFDAVVVLLPNLTGQVLAFNAAGPPTATPLPSGAVTVSGSTLKGVIPFAALPSTGFTSANYLYNLWPRDGLVSNDQISDFAPNASSFAANVPEPVTWAMMIVGLGMAGAMLRGRRRMTAA